MEPDSWQSLFDRHAATLVLFARQWRGSHADAEDAVQEGFVRFWRSRRDADDPAAYLFACVKHTAMNGARGDARRQRREQSVASGREAVSSFEHPVIDQERADVIERSLAGLPVEQREVIVMKLWGGLTFAQIAAALGQPANTVASRYRYGLESLRRTMNQEQVS